MHRRWVVAGAIAILLLVGACDGSDDEPIVQSTPSSAVSSAPSPSVSPIASCPNEESVADDESSALAGELTGDVDGDGSSDKVVIHVDPTGETSCRAFLVVDTNDAVVAGPIWAIGSDGGMSEPALHSLALINSEPGAEIVVREAQGASTSLVAAYALIGDQVVRIETGERVNSKVLDNVTGLFPFGGSVGHMEAVDCGGPGIVVTLAEPGDSKSGLRGGSYTVTREFYEVIGATMELVSRDKVEARAQDIAVTFPEYSSSPFGSCGP